MLKLKKHFSRLTIAALAIGTVAFASAQSQTTIAAEFGTAPSAADNFTVNLVSTEKADIAGFAFKLVYDPTQVAIIGVTDVTGQSSSKVQYTLGAETAADATGATAQRILTATTNEDLKSASKLVQVKFAKKPGFAAPFKFDVADRTTEPIIDGLQGSDLQNIPHTFDTSAVTK